jgi:hypothetical protein
MNEAGFIQAQLFPHEPLAMPLRRIEASYMNTLSKTIYCIAYLLCGAATAYAHPHDFEGWLNTNALIELDREKKYQLYVEVQPRVADNWQRAATFHGRTALAYSVGPSLSLYLGYAWTPALYDANYHRDYRDEQRLWQQLLFRYDLYGFQWQHRFRQEQRMITRTNGEANRSRYLIRSSYALNERKSFGVTAFNEIMFHWESLDNGPWKGYDRSRLFLGPYWILGSCRYELGYLGEHLKRFGSDERWAHVLQLSASYHGFL